ncbi:MAG TPA: PIN domain-containing protein [Thermoanaerobaculia bacterium]|nr:PIN domain-containing protein [Thermoanaerobaculia bacterium]
MIVLDTSVLSRALRRKRSLRPADAAEDRLRTLIRENVPICIPGVVYQEILSGIRTTEQFAELRSRLEPFSLVPASIADHVEAAQLINSCRAVGVRVSAIDALIAGMTIRMDGDLFTFDADFTRIAQVVPFRVLSFE